MHSFFLSIITFVLIGILFLLCQKSEAAPTYNAHHCRNTTIFAPNSTYQAHLNSLLSDLSSNAPYSCGFYNTTAGIEPPDVVYGLFLCRGDLPAITCQECVSTAAKEILRRCPREKESYIWYDECSLRYNNKSIFSIIREVPGAYIADTKNVTDPDQFNQLLSSTMNSLDQSAATDASGKKFATREVNFTSNQTLYSLVQCTPDLSVYLCDRCLQSAIASIPMCCNGKEGGRVLLPSCVLRYGLSPFYRASNTALVPSATNINGRRKVTPQVIATIGVPIIILLLLLSLGICFLRRRSMEQYSAMKEKNGEKISDISSLQFDLATLKAATNDCHR